MWERTHSGLQKNIQFFPSLILANQVVSICFPQVEHVICTISSSIARLVGESRGSLSPSPYTRGMANKFTFMVIDTMECRDGCSQESDCSRCTYVQWKGRAEGIDLAVYRGKGKCSKDL